jgi:predicted permease
MIYQSNRSRRLLIAYVLQDVRRVARSSMQDLLRLILPCFSFSNFLLLLDRDLARPYCVSLVFAIE